MELRIAELFIAATSSIAGLVLYTLSLTGCVSDSPGLSGIFLVALNSSNAAELRIGYFGVCISNGRSRTCVATPYSSTPESLKAAFVSQSGREDAKSSIPPMETLKAALQLQQGIFFCIQAFAGVLFMVGIMLFAIRVCIQTSKRKEQNWRFITQNWPEKVIMSSIFFSAISATSVTQTSNALRFTSSKPDRRSLQIETGLTLQVLQWLAFASSATFYIVAVKRAAKRTPSKPPKGEKLSNLSLPSSSLSQGQEQTSQVAKPHPTAQRSQGAKPHPATLRAAAPPGPS